MGKPSGRPPVGNPVHLRMGDLLPEVDAYAAARGVTRAQAARELIRAGLDAARRARARR